MPGCLFLFFQKGVFIRIAEEKLAEDLICLKLDDAGIQVPTRRYMIPVELSIGYVPYEMDVLWRLLKYIL